MALVQNRIFTIEDIYNLPEGERAELIDGQIYMMYTISTSPRNNWFSLSKNCRLY